jgi:tetratricopeptide (TPR) repeat protein
MLSSSRLTRGLFACFALWPIAGAAQDARIASTDKAAQAVPNDVRGVIPLRQEPVPQEAPPAKLTPRQIAELRGDILMARKMYPEAVAAYQAVLRQEPRNATLLNKVGIAYYQQNNMGQAKRYYERAIKADPKFAFAVNNLGMVHFMRRKWGPAAGEFRKAIELDPELAPAYSNLGYAYFQQKKYDLALAAFQRAIVLDPEVFERKSSSTGTLLQSRSVEDRAFYFYFLARFYAGVGDVERCASYLRKARDEGYKRMADVPNDPAFSAVIKDPRIQEILQPNPIAQVPKP